MQHGSTRELVFGAFMAALTLVLHLAGMALPLVYILLPLPVALAAIRLQRRSAVLAGAVAVLIAVVTVGWFQALSVLLIFGVAPGLVLGWAIRDQASALRAVTLAALTMVAGLLVTTVIGIWAAEVDYRTQLEPAMDQAVAQMRANLDRLAAQQQITPEQRQQFDQALEQMRSGILYFLPIGLALVAAPNALLSYLLALWLFPRLGHQPRTFPPFVEWALPTWMTWVYLPVFGLFVATAYIQGLPGWLVLMVQMALSWLMLFYAVQGMAVAAWWLHRRTSMGLSSRGAAWLVVGGSVLLARLAFPVLMLLGIIDANFDFRKLRLQPGLE